MLSSVQPSLDGTTPAASNGKTNLQVSSFPVQAPFKEDTLSLSGAKPTATAVFQANGVPYLPAYRFTGNNRVALFYDGPEIHPQMEKLITEARESIKLDYFIFSGQEAMRLAEMIVAKSRSGVKVQVMFDPRQGSLTDIKASGRQISEYLKKNGIEVVFANYDALPPLLNRAEGFPGRLIDHNKIIIVDDRSAMIGGWNLADKFNHFHDGMVRIDGPAVGDLVQQFALDWHFAGHPEDAKKGLTTPALPGKDNLERAEGLSAVRVNSTGINRQNNQWAILERISRAHKSIHATLIELDDDSIVEALIVARNRGLDVRVLLDPNDFSNLLPALKRAPREWINARALKQLLDAGVPVHYFRVSAKQDVVHSKMAVVDGDELLIGSTDWHAKELRHTSDTSVEVIGGPAPAKAQRIFLNDWENKSYPAQMPAWYKQALSRLYFTFS